MGKQYVIVEGKNYEKLIEEGMQKLNAKNDEIDIEVLESKKGLFATQFKLKISLKNYEASLDKISSSLENLYEINSDLQYDPDFKIKQVELEFKEDGVYLVINENANLDDIKEKLALRKIQNVDMDAIKQYLLDKNYGTPLKISEPQVEEAIDSKCELRLSKDLMEALIYIIPPHKGADITEEAIYQFLKENSIVYGIKNEIISRIVAEKIYDKDVLVAAGVAPENGKDAVLHYHFDVSNERKIKIDSEGKIDFRELSLIKNIAKGDTLVTLTPCAQGTAGKNVMGVELSAKSGKPLSLPRGKNVEISEDGLNLLSTIDGEVKLIDGKVSVFAMYEVPTNVDNSTGNIRFVGKVSVKGNVLTGFEIEAEGDVEVFGVVEGAKIVSKGNIILHRGIQGMNKGELYCDGDLIAKFIENSTIEAKGNIHSDAIMHSHVVCGKKLEVTGKKGLLVGGWFKVSEEVKAKVIGSPMATVTEIEVGINPDSRRKYEQLKSEQKQANENLEKTAQAVEMLTKISKKTELPDDKKVLMQKSIQLKLQLQHKLDQLSKELKELEEYFEEANKGKIKASDVVYPGSRIIIGSSMMYVKDPLKFVTFYRANAEVKIGPFED